MLNNGYASSSSNTLHRLSVTDDGVQRLLLRFLLDLLGAVVRLLAEIEAGALSTPDPGTSAPPLLLASLQV